MWKMIMIMFICFKRIILKKINFKTQCRIALMFRFRFRFIFRCQFLLKGPFPSSYACRPLVFFPTASRQTSSTPFFSHKENCSYWLSFPSFFQSSLNSQFLYYFPHQLRFMFIFKLIFIRFYQLSCILYSN